MVSPTALVISAWHPPWRRLPGGPCDPDRNLSVAAAADDPVVKGLLEALDELPDRRWSEHHVTDMGYDLSTVRRSFKRHFGMTFLEIARQRRLREGFETLAEGGKVVTAQHKAGFDSPSAFRAAFARILGCAPGDLSRDGLLRANWIKTPLGDMIAVASSTHLHLLEFIDRKALPGELKRLRAAAKGSIGLGRTGPMEQAAAELGDFFAGRSARFETPLHQEGSAFAHAVWSELRAIPAGQTRSYGQIAEAIGKPSAVRAVARANGANTIALVVPCHRVIGANGALTGYGGGLWRKQRLLEIERQYRAERLEAERGGGG
jgi:AraC family transcriptional regulator of adaptative response/methylated-DNA-[protein]-cysteine methyltransferase